MYQIKTCLMLALVLTLSSITVADLLPPQTIGSLGTATAADASHTTAPSLPDTGFQNENPTGHVVASINGQVVFDSENGGVGANPPSTYTVSLGSVQDENPSPHVVATVNGQVVYDSTNGPNETGAPALNRNIGPLPYTTNPTLGPSSSIGLLGIGGGGGMGGVGGMSGMQLSPFNSPLSGFGLTSGLSSGLPLQGLLMYGAL